MTSTVVTNLISWSYETLKGSSKDTGPQSFSFSLTVCQFYIQSSDFLSSQDVCGDIYK